MRREEKPNRCHWMVYCTYNMLNLFQALLCPSSGARDYMCVITAYGVRCLGCWLLEVRCRTSGYASRMRDVARATSFTPNTVSASAFQTTGRQKLECIIPHAVKHSLVLLRMDKKLPKTCWADWNINKFLFLHLVGFLHYLYQWRTVKQTPNLHAPNRLY